MAELPPSQVGAEEARDLADRVLSDRAYVEAARPPSLQQRLFEWIGDRFGDLLEALSTTGSRGIVAWVIIGAFGALIIFLVGRLLRGVGTLPVRPPDHDPTIDVMADRSADEWLAAAAEAESTGDWRVAIRCRHRALVTKLIGAGVVAAREGLTAGEIATAVAAAQPAAAQPMNEATWLFKDIWYGWIDATASSRDEFVRLSSDVITKAVDHPTGRTEQSLETVGV